MIREGKGPPCRPGQTILVHYVGTLPDGKQFDSSRDRKEPLELLLGARKVMPGLELVLARMRVGDRWKVSVPWPLAYGDKGKPPAIPGRTEWLSWMTTTAADGVVAGLAR